MPVFSADGLIDDPWVTIADGESPTGNAPTIVSWEQVRSASQNVLDKIERCGIVVASDIDPTALIPYVTKLNLIVVQSVSFKDGRMFSAGWLIRHRYGFKNELRLQGDVIPDQIPFLVSCGYTSFSVNTAFDIPTALGLLKTIPLSYQSGRSKRDIMSLRHSSLLADASGSR